MTAPTPDASWPNPARPGLPLNPERDGVHRMTFNHASEHDWIWRATPAPFWVTHSGALVDPTQMASFRAHYIGPLITPAQVAAAVQAEREACAAEGERIRDMEGSGFSMCMQDVIDAIRARTSTDALADLLAQAREAGQ